MNVDYGYDDIENWIYFLIDIETSMLDLTGNGSMVESLSISRRVKYNWKSKKTPIRKPSSNSLILENKIFAYGKTISLSLYISLIQPPLATR